MPNISNQQLQQGFLLTRQAYDSPGGLLIVLWLKTDTGAVKLEVDNELAVFFVKQKDNDVAREVLRKNKIVLFDFKDIRLKTFTFESVTCFYFKSLHHFYRARELLSQHDIICYEDDIRPDDRYLMERYITADIEYIANTSLGSTMDKQKVTPLNNRYSTIPEAKCRQGDRHSSLVLNMLSLDIECSMEGELYSIGLYSADAPNNANLASEQHYRCVLMIGEPEIDSDDYILWLKDEKELLTQLLDKFSLFDPDIIIGWNVINFDFNLLQTRFDLHNIKFSIGRDNSEPRWRTNKSNTEQRFIEIAGRVVLDGIDLLKSATYSFNSYSLDNVANILLGVGKKVDNLDNKLDEINHNFQYNKTALAAYNLQDCELVWNIFEKTHLLSFAMLRAKLTGLSIDRVGGSVAAFTNLYLPKLHRAGYIAPNLGDGKSDLISPGGYVMDSVPGLYNNVIVLDFKSLYPSIIRSFKIDPLGLIEGMTEVGQVTKLTNNNSTAVVPGYDGALFSRDKHFLPQIIESLWLERDKAKKQNNPALSQAIKIIMNSFYGILGSTGCRFYDPRLAGSITKRSHDILKTTQTWIENLGYQVIYGDTDSIFVALGDDNSESSCHQIGNELQTIINNKWQETLNENYQLPSYLEIEFETLFNRFLMPTIRGNHQNKQQKSIGTKKRYAGLSGEKLVFKGLETVRSDWTELSKEFQQALYKLIFNNQPVEAYVVGLVHDIKKGVFDDKLIYTKKIRRRLADYLNTPPHIKAALNANQYYLSKGGKAKYEHRSIIQYVMTLDGVQTVELQHSKLDYDFYIEKQLKPIANDILPFINQDFDNMISQQLSIFS